MKKIGFVGMVLGLCIMAGVASAESFLEKEAGISASIKLSSANLTQAQAAFKNIERKTDGYIIGSVSIDGYGKNYDVHVYVDTSGHMVAYYLKAEPASKIIDWINHKGGPMTLAGCKLEDALVKVCTAMFYSLPAVTYYDFRYPDSQTIKIVTDELLTTGTEEFTMFIPSGHIVYSATWSRATYRSNYTYRSSGLYLNEVSLSLQKDVPAGWKTLEGTISLGSLLLDTHHKFALYNETSLNNYAAIVLIYTEF